MTRTMLAALLLSSVSTAALAQEHRHAGTHVHGLAELAVALNLDGTLVAELESPLYNLIGFERAPRNDAEYALVANAIEALRESALPAFNTEAGCALDGVELDGFPHTAPHSGGHDHDHMDHDGDEPHDHDHDHDHHAHDDDTHEAEHEYAHYGDHSEAETPPQSHDHAHDHGHGHSHSHSQGEGERRYSDGFVTWSFTCSAPDRLTGMDAAALFEAFERLERVDVQFFDGTRAASQTLTPTASRLSIR